MMKNKTLGLTQLAKESNVNLQTVRYYLREGLISPHTDEFGKKLFTAEHIKQIKFIKQSQSVGFSLSEIHEILNMRLHKKSNCSPIKKKIHEKTHEVSEKITQLKNILKLLKSFEDKCDGHENSGHCSIIEEISKLKI